MKSKYMSRKFILALLWAILGIVATLLSNEIKFFIIGSIPTITFILGEAFVDSRSCVQQRMYVGKETKVEHELYRHDNFYDANSEVKDAGKEDA